MTDFVWKELALKSGVVAGVIGVVALSVAFQWRRAIILCLLTLILATDAYCWGLAPNAGLLSDVTLTVIDLLYVIAFLLAAAFIFVKDAQQRLLGSMVSFVAVLFCTVLYWALAPHLNPALVDELASAWGVGRFQLVLRERIALSICLAVMLVVLFGLLARNKCELRHAGPSTDLPAGYAWRIYAGFLFIQLMVFRFV